MLERESKREKNLEARAKEMRKKEQRMAESQESSEQKATWQEQEKEIEEDFWRTIEAFSMEKKLEVAAPAAEAEGAQEDGTA